MRCWGTLYFRTRDAALDGDETARRLWFLIAFAAAALGDAALNQRFSDDLLPAYEAEPEAFLKSLAGAPWLAGTICDRIAAHYGSSYRRSSELDEFLASEEGRFRVSLPTPAARACLTAMGVE